MAKAQCHFTVKNGKPGPVEVTDGELPDGDFVIGWGFSRAMEMLIVMFSPVDTNTTLHAQARTMFPRVGGD